MEDDKIPTHLTANDVSLYNPLIRGKGFWQLSPMYGHLHKKGKTAKRNVEMQIPAIGQ